MSPLALVLLWASVSIRELAELGCIHTIISPLVFAGMVEVAAFVVMLICFLGTLEGFKLV